ncbi:SDR family NAD(P)-dependent oxidoreductase [Pelagicoccus mobilis]|uniref:SDR family NAD(P)-dependent oxidoreductase n=1 Tax=Pelagicoccus mobilis TaxID=415221 RepID=A0A934VS25_9BACT|nr:SDR family NAD(P)-dependent oxidoreductase [Pelagicoccus mobilis]MBK1878228.1 SDR family NAD(P)-dependent oxidoreductase [Pelagicoccus mobilis]
MLHLLDTQKGMNAVVTGASGFIGKHLVEHLSEDPSIQLKLIVRDSSKQLPARNTTKAILWTNQNECESAIQEADYIFHIAGNPNFNDKNASAQQEANIDLTRRLLSFIPSNTGLKRFIYLSTTAAMDRPKSWDNNSPIQEDDIPYPRTQYGKSKREAEIQIEKSGLPYTIIRVGPVFGPGMRNNSHLAVLSKIAQKNGLLSKLNFPGLFSLIHVKDVARALSFLASNPKAENQTFHLSHPESHTLGRLLAELRTLHGNSPTQWNFPQHLAKGISFLKKFLPPSLSNLLFNYYWVQPKKVEKLGFTFDIHPLEELPRFVREQRDTQPSHSKETIVITGGASGIGLALSRSLFALGYHVAIIDKNESSLKDAKRSLDALTIQADLTKTEEIERAFSDLSSLQSEVVGLINNAGVGYRGAFRTSSLEKADLVTDLNIKAPLRICHHALNGFPKLESIINVCSSSAFQPLPFIAPYAASKAFLLSFSLALKEECDRDNNSKCKVITVCPSGTNTNFQETAGVKKTSNQGLLTPEETAAQIIRKGFLQKKPLVLIGSSCKGMNLIARILPHTKQAKLWGKLMQSLR